MPILIFALLIIICAIIFNSKNKHERILNIKKILSILGGIASFTILSKILPFIFAFLTSLILVFLPFLNKIIKLMSIFSIIKPLFKKVKIKKYEAIDIDQMTIEEALDILSVKNSASEFDIKKSYIEKMKKNHPDIGGSDYIAKKLTKARDLLLKLKK